MILDLIGNINNCKRDCPSFIKGWSDWINSPRPFGQQRIVCIANTNYLTHACKPAMIVFPETHAQYLKKIGCKSRNMISKSVRNGYNTQVINFNDFLDDIYNVNISKSERQGQPMTQNYKIKPTPISRPSEYCELHFSKHYGVIKDGKLFAWANISFMNELVIVNQILGHGEHLKFGIMNNLISFIVKDSIENHPQTKCLNYLTIVNGLEGLKSFKRSVGFEEIECKFKKI